MKLNVFVTLLVATVLMLASINMATASTSANTKAVTSTTVAVPASAIPASDYHLALAVSRSTNLIDFQDGTRNDSMDYSLTPSMKTSFGTVTTSLAYSQNLRDQYSRTASDWSDIPLVLSFRPKLFRLADRDAKIFYSISAVVPTSQYSVKKDQLQTAISGKVGFSLSASDGAGLSFITGISLGRNFHAFEEDINGNVLNQYSSNQNIGVNYSMGNWSISTDIVNHTRMTYANQIRSFFEISEEVGYSLNSYISIALGHTNAGSTLKPNAADSNIELYNENSSIVYATLGLAY